MTRLSFLSSLFGIFAASGLGQTSLAAGQTARVSEAAAYCDNANPGPVTVVLKYDQPVNAASIACTAFAVPGYVITNAYSNAEAAHAPTPRNGNFVILELRQAAPARIGTSLQLRQVAALASASGEILMPQAAAITCPLHSAA
ncbi:MAG: hypothetical protein KGO53_14460 [Alphaproteobacteria bacterium]|nr:hypothetical protein [Alphaproteobacteria bacterium]